METTSRLPVVIEEAPFPFVLLGPCSSKRTLLVRSGQLDLLLLGAVMVPNQPTSIQSDEKNANPQLSSLDPYDLKRTITIVQVTAKVDDDPESRLEPFTLAWIGKYPAKNVDKLKEYFSNSAVAIHRAIFSEPPRDIRSDLAPLLFMCAKATTRPRFQTMRKVLWIILQVLNNLGAGFLFILLILYILVQTGVITLKKS